MSNKIIDIDTASGTKHYINTISDRIRAVIEDYINLRDRPLISYAEIVGILELIKLDVYNSMNDDS